MGPSVVWGTGVKKRETVEGPELRAVPCLVVIKGMAAHMATRIPRQDISRCATLERGLGPAGGALFRSDRNGVGWGVKNFLEL